MPEIVVANNTPAAGFQSIDANGNAAGAKAWHGVVTTASDGSWVADYSAAGFTEAPGVQAIAVGAAGASGARNATLSADPTTTQAGGTVSQPALAVLGLLSLSLVGAGVKVQVLAVGK